MDHDFMRNEPTDNLHDFFEDKAREGDGTFAIAYALMELAQAQRRAAEALDRLGLNYSSNTEQPGAVERLAMQAERLARAADRTAGALEEGVTNPERAG
jgi:hypothetical protein